MVVKTSKVSYKSLSSWVQGDLLRQAVNSSPSESKPCSKESDFVLLALTLTLLSLFFAGETEFSETARVFVEHICQNFTSLHAKVKGYSQDGVPMVELYYTDNEQKVR